MRILRARLLATEAAGRELARFYGVELGLPVLTEPRAWRAFRAGATVVEFAPVATGQPFYHYALRVPRNRFVAAREWLAATTDLLTAPDSDDGTFQFSSWNAEACYAHDPCGNIVELIAHHELPDETPNTRPFTAAELLGVCELGLVGPDTKAMARALEPLAIQLWDGTVDEPERLAFLGGPEGTLILAPPGRGWLPTGRPAEAHGVQAVVAGAREAEAKLPGTEHRIRTAVTGR